MKKTTHFNSKPLSFATLLLGFVFVVVLSFILMDVSSKTSNTSALSGSDFNAGNIIDDSVFYNDSAMSVSQIQSFLDAKVPNCDTNGERWHWSGQTRAEYAAESSSRDNPPYTCLKDYTENIPGVSNGGSDLCTGSISSGTKSSARIIYDVSKACGINPQVLIVMLQKEQSLVTDDWPWQIQYDRAMGYACPDSGPNNSANCDSSYYGFFNQVYNAAKAFRRYESNPGWYNYKPLRNNSILYHPNTSCGRSDVFIQNQATANLYIYTPYQPNQAALNNLYGTGNSCSAYGNRNFWRMFNDWFGSTKGESIEVTGNLKYSPASPMEGDRVATSFIIKNNENRDIMIDQMVVAARDGDNNNVNFPTVSNITLGPGEEYQYYERTTFDNPGKHKLWIAVQLPSGVWMRDWPRSASGNIIREREFDVLKIPHVTLSEELKHSPESNLSTEDTVTATFKLKNNESSKLKINDIVVAARDETGKNVNFKTISGLTLNPGQEYTYRQKRKFSSPGEHHFWIAARLPSGVWTRDWPASETELMARDNSPVIAQIPNISLDGYLKFSPNPPLLGQTAATSFIIKNNEDQDVTIDQMVVAARDSDNNNVNFPAVSDITLEPGEEYQYYEYTTFDNPGKHKLWIAVQLPSGVWVRDWPRSAGNNIIREREFSPRLANVTLSRSLKYSPVSPSIGQSVGSSFVIKNNENRQVKIDEIVVAARDKAGANKNFTTLKDISLGPDEEHEYYEYNNFDTEGEHRLWIATRLPSGSWTRGWPHNNLGLIDGRILEVID